MLILSVPRPVNVAAPAADPPAHQHRGPVRGHQVSQAKPGPISQIGGTSNIGALGTTLAAINFVKLAICAATFRL